MSISNLAIIVVVSIVGTSILSIVSSCLVLRYRRKKTLSQRAEAVGSNEKFYKGPIAVRGSSSPRFPHLSRDSTSPMDDFRLPSLSPLVQPKKAQREARNNIGFAASIEESGSAKRVASDVENKRDADAVWPPVFRLQKNNGVRSATTIRLIRVGSRKGNASTYADIQQNMPPPRVVTTSDLSQDTAFTSIPNQSSMQSSSQTNATITQPTKVQRSPSKGRRIGIRSTSSSDTEISNWRPPMRLTETGGNRFRFQDSNIDSSEPTPIDLDTFPPPNTNTSSPCSPRPAGDTRAGKRENHQKGSPSQRGGTFATFPRARRESSREGG